jgi:branched-chain amino acid transport system permease protein
VQRIPVVVFKYVVVPVALLWLAWWGAPQKPALTLQILLALALVVPLGPMVYRLAYQPLASASVLVLLIISVAVHFAMTGLGLVFFGAEGSRTPPFSDAQWKLGVLNISGQSLWVLGASLALIVALLLFFERTIYGKALRATAINRVGARLVGVSPVMAGRLSFTLAALIGALSGILIAPITTVYYDSGFLIGLKGFVGAIMGGLVSYPMAAAGALLVGMLEAYASFWASAYKEVIVFTLIIPVLVWRSLTTHHIEEEEE